MRLTFDALEYSRTAGMMTISGSGYLPVAKEMANVDGVDGVEHDADNEEYVLTYNKADFSKEGIKDIYKKIKKNQ